MQRKNYILNSKKGRSGFAMIMALAVVMVISTILALSLSLTTQTAKRTTDLYIYEQAVLLSKSATEYALLQISQNGCINSNNSKFNFKEDIYDINISAQYVYTGASTCKDYFQISTPETNGTVLLDVTVTLNDKNIASEPIRFFRRSIQKL